MSMEEKKEKKKMKKGFEAKKDFVICQNDFYFEIKKGDIINKEELKKFWENLKTEKVI